MIHTEAVLTAKRRVIPSTVPYTAYPRECCLPFDRPSVNGLVFHREALHRRVSEQTRNFLPTNLLRGVEGRRRKHLMLRRCSWLTADETRRMASVEASLS